MARTKKVGMKSPRPKKRRGASASTSKPLCTKRKTSRRFVLEDGPSSEEEVQQQVEEEQQQGEQEEQIPYDKSCFTSAANEAWYNSRMGAKILVEKDVTSNAEEVYHLKGYFAKLGWENFFNLSNIYYEEFVCEFYANVEGKQSFHFDTEDITSVV